MFLLVVNISNPKLRPKSQEACFQELQIWHPVAESWQFEACESPPSDHGELPSTFGAPGLVLLRYMDQRRRSRLKTTGLVHCGTLLDNLISKKKFGFRAVFLPRPKKKQSKTKPFLALVLAHSPNSEHQSSREQLDFYWMEAKNAIIQHSADAIQWDFLRWWRSCVPSVQRGSQQPRTATHVKCVSAIKDQSAYRARVQGRRGILRHWLLSKHKANLSPMSLCFRSNCILSFISF